jgi:hypothetical protein
VRRAKFSAAAEWSPELGILGRTAVKDFATAADAGTVNGVAALATGTATATDTATALGAGPTATGAATVGTDKLNGNDNVGEKLSGRPEFRRGTANDDPEICLAIAWVCAAAPRGIEAESNAADRMSLKQINFFTAIF